MQAGRLFRRVRIERKVLTQSESGDPIETWSALAVRFASIFPLKADEKYTGEQWAAQEQVSINVRYGEIISDLTPLDRVVYPIPDDTSPPTPIPSTSIYDIMGVSEIGRRKGLKIFAARREDTAP